MRCSCSFASMKPRVSADPRIGMSPGGAAGRARRRLVLVTVGQHDRRRTCRAVPDGVEVGRIRSTPGWSGSGNSTPQSTISTGRRFEDRHVATDLAETAEGDDAQRAGADRAGLRQVLAHQRVVPATLGSAPPAAALRSGRKFLKSAPAHVVRRSQLVLDHGGLRLLRSDKRQPHPRAADTAEAVEHVLRGDGAGDVGHDGADQRLEQLVLLGRGGQVAAVHGVHDRAVRRGGDVRGDADQPGGADREVRQHVRVVAREVQPDPSGSAPG